MKKIPVVTVIEQTTDENGLPVESPVNRPAEPLPNNAIRTECDGVNYTVYEQGD